MISLKQGVGFGAWWMVAAFACVACSDSDKDGGSSSSSSSTSSYCCGLNKAYFDCPSSDALRACGQGDTSACTSRKDACD